MALNPMLDLELALCCARFTLPGNWQPVDGTWDDFGNGRTAAVRTIRHRGERYWVTATNEMEDGLAALVARGLRDSKPRSYRHFELHQRDPRRTPPRERKAGNLGGVGVITRVNKVVAEQGWNK